MPNKIWPKPKNPNRPVDLTVAKMLHRGDILHKGQCREGDQLYWGDHRHTRYYVTYLEVDEKQQTFKMRLASEHVQIVFPVSQEQALQYHRVEDCASRKRRPPNNKPGPATPAQQFTGLGQKTRRGPEEAK